MNKFYSTKIVIDIESGVVEEKDQVRYDGPWALCGFDTSVAGAILKEVSSLESVV